MRANTHGPVSWCGGNTHTHTHIIYIGNLKSGEQSAKIYQGEIVSGLWAPPVFFDPITAKVSEFDRLVAEKGYQYPPLEEWPGSLMGMEEIAATWWGDPRDWFHPYHRLNEAASMPSGSGPPDLTKSRTFSLRLVLEL